MKKRNLALLISAAILALTGIVMLILGYALQGTNILAWFTTKWGITAEIMVGLYLIIVLIICINDWRQKL